MRWADRASRPVTSAQPEWKRAGTGWPVPVPLPVAVAPRARGPGTTPARGAWSNIGIDGVGDTGNTSMRSLEPAK